MKRISIASLLLLLFICLLAPCQARADGRIELLILHTNDFHGALLPAGDIQMAPPPEKIGGAAYMAAKIRELRDKDPGHVMLVDGGDCAMGTALSNALHGIPVIDYMNLAGYEAMALGNHEFEWGVGKLMAMQQRAKFPFLAANLIDGTTGKIPPYAKPYIIVEKEGLKIGIIGLISKYTPTLQNPNRIRNLLFLSPEEPTMKVIEELRGKGIRTVFVVSHLGYREDRDLVAKVSGIDCIIGGHSHTALHKAEKVNNTIIVQAGFNGRHLGRLKLTLDRDSGRVISYMGDLIPIIDKDIAPDKEVEAMLEPYQEKIKESMSEILGTAEEDLLNTPLGDSQSTALGNFVTDALRVTCKSDLALYKSDAIRTNILKGPIRKGDLYQVLPFDNKVIKAELRGNEIRAMLEFLMESPFLTQASGLSVTYHGDRKKGKRIEAFLTDGQPLVDNKGYTIAMVDYLFYLYYKSGGFDVLKKKHRTEVLSREIVERYITKTKEIALSPEHRVKKLPAENHPPEE
jgi:5'-nucleotidase / UDP-sugar diphosphatase